MHLVKPCFNPEVMSILDASWNVVLRALRLPPIFRERSESSTAIHCSSFTRPFIITAVFADSKSVKVYRLGTLLFLNRSKLFILFQNTYVSRIVTYTMLQRIIAIITLASFGLLVTMLVTTTPASAGPFGLLLIFISAYLTSLGLISFFLYGASRVLVYATSGFALRRPAQVMPFRRAYYYSTILAAAPVMLIGLQSVGSIGIYEFALVVIFVGIGCVYISKRIY